MLKIRLGPNNPIVKALIEKGLTKSQAIDYSSLVFNLIRTKILTGEEVELPSGFITRIPETRHKQRRINVMQNKPEFVYKHKFKFKFKPKDKVIE